MTPYPLEPSRADTLEMGRRSLEAINDFVDGLPKAPSFDTGDLDSLVAELLRPPPEGPGDFGGLLDRFRRAAEKSVETAGPGYLAFIPGGGLITSALAELLANAINRYTGLSGLAPGPVALEHGVMRWLCGEFGLPAGAVGVATTGGSIATLSAMVAARHDRLGEDIAGGTIYATPHAHLCVAKAARIAGFPAAAIRVVPTTSDLRMDVGAAERMVAEDRASGLRPFVLVGTAGTTNTGTVDPLPELGALARREGLWFHVDAAYGGFFQLTDRGRERLTGIDIADSVVLDPHKGMFLPYGTGVLLVRDQVNLRTAFTGDGDYLQDLDAGEQLPDYNSLGPELTRDFRGLRLWLPLHLHGVAAFRDALDEKLDLAAEAYDALVADPLIECPSPPDLSVVTFRLQDGTDDDQRAMLDRINASRRVFLSSTRIDGRNLLRLCVLGHRTHADRAREAVEIIRAAARG